MAGRFPGAPDIDAFWTLLREGREASRSFSREELLARGVPAEVVDDPLFVARGPVLDGIDLFDAAFFGFSPRDAAIMDPQHRLFLECAWEALEHAGYDPARPGGAVGVFAGSGMHAYLIYHLATNPALMASVGEFLVRHTGNDKDFLPTRVSYEFDLQGPSVGVQTACSTSLVAVHLAIQSLLSGESDLAMAGGVSVLLEQENGYTYQPGEILSPDGHCRAFDADAAGTVFGSGVGVVVLKRLADALRDGDTVHCVLLGSAVNNDGRRKVGYLAPSVDGQAAVVAEALAVAGVEPGDISYVEAHGTGTPVGDPIEVAALNQAFGPGDGRDTVGLGSVKSNVGHLDTAAGVASLIKATLALNHREIPPSLHVRSPHPGLALESGPFYVVGELRPWDTPESRPRRAGVSSLGVGGTNAHVVVEEPPAVEAGGPSRRFQLLCLSARNDAALAAAGKRLAHHLRAHPEQGLADVAHTLHVGRRAFAHRRFAVVAPDGDAAAAVEGRAGATIAPAGGRRLAFLFAGGGAQHPAMARGLYDAEPVFRAALDAGLDRLMETEGLDLRPILLNPGTDPSAAAAALSRPAAGLPALFLVQHALAELWSAWGVTPAALIGHSAGEYAAAVRAGVMSFDDALALVALRGRLFETLPPGGMVSVALPEHELRARAAAAGVDVAAVNGQGMGVVSGSLGALATFEEGLARDGLEGSRLHIDVAAHSSHVDSILDEFRGFVASLSLSEPRIPIASNVTGAWMTPSDATDPDYWVRHLRETVRFASGLETLLEDESMALLEVGPGRTLATLARAHHRFAGRPIITSMRHPSEPADDQEFALRALGALWSAGVDVDWAGFYAAERRRRVPLPTYPFQRERHWIERGRLPAADTVAEPDAGRAAADQTPAVSDWLGVTAWAEAPAALPDRAAGDCLFFDDGSDRVGDAIGILQQEGTRVVRVLAGASFARPAADVFQVRGGEPDDYAALVATLESEGRLPDRIVHAWATGTDPSLTGSFFSVYHLVRALGERDAEASYHLDLVTAGSQRVRDADRVTNPAGALLAGVGVVLPAEFEGVTTRFIDVGESTGGAELAFEMRRRPDAQSSVIALRNGQRFAPVVVPAPLEATDAPWLRPGAACLITGGYGGMGLELAKSVAGPGARIALVGRSTPDARVEAALADMRSAGADVLTLRADVTDEAGIESAVADARRHFGRIDVVVHAAGVLDDAPVLLKDPERAADVLAPKVRGTVALVSALAGDPPETLVLCSSVSARVGLAGQMDYAAANAFLDAYAAGATGPTRVLSIGWGAWRDVGMAASLDGDAVDPILAGASCDLSLHHPLLSQRASGGVPVYEAVVKESDWVADEHRLSDGRALMPGSAIIELVRAACGEEIGPRVELEAVVLRAPLFVSGTRSVRVHVTGEAARREFVVASRAGAGWTIHATGRARPAPPPPAVGVDPPGDDAVVFGPAEPFVPQPGRLHLGPRWAGLRRLELRDSEVRAELVLPPSVAAADAGYVLHPALLDLATGAALSLVPPDAGLWVPLGYDRVAAWRATPNHALVCARRAGATSHGTARFDLDIADSDGRVVARVEGLTMRVVDESALSRRAGGRAAGNQGTGIATEQGIDALGRLMASGRRGALVVSPVPLEVLVGRRAGGGPAALPTYAGDGALEEAPRDEIEEYLVGQWRELLGTRRVGLHDDFFDLGGHSLLALRLFARLEKRFKSTLPLATLFEAPTVARLAERVRGGPISVTSLEVTHSAGAGARRSFEHLVRICDGGDAPPFFCVHGAGGNVLNFRDLAIRLRHEGAVYGLQARGVDGLQEPHASIEEMAEAYLAEVRAVCPKGPFLLGGYSGGGVIAFEMAHRLRSEGERVAALVLLDTFRPGAHAPERPKATDRWAGRLRRLFAQGPSYAGAWARERAQFESWRFRRLLLSVPRKAGQPLPAALREVKLTGAFLAAADRYRIQPLDVPMVLFTAGERPGASAGLEPDLGWGAFAAAGLDLRVASGTHDNLVREPHVDTLAEALRGVLRRAVSPAAESVARGMPRRHAVSAG